MGCLTNDKAVVRTSEVARRDRANEVMANSDALLRSSVTLRFIVWTSARPYMISFWSISLILISKIHSGDLGWISMLQVNQRLTSSSLILLSNPAIFSAFSSFASPSLGASFSVEYVRLAAKTLEATELDGLACRLTILRSGCSDDNERDIIVLYMYRWNNRLNLENPKFIIRFR